MFFILFYQILFFIAYPFIFLYFSLFLLPKGEITRWRHLLLGLTGKIKKNTKGKCIWIHGVSGGEIKLVKELLEIAPSNQFFHLTTSNITGYQVLGKAYSHSSTISYSYHPLDFFFVIYPWIRAINPRKLIVVEHDQWPCSLYLLKKIGVTRYLVNIEFKPQDLKRYRRFPFILKYVFNYTAFTYQNVHAQDLAKTLCLNQIGHSLFAQNLKFLNLFQHHLKRKNPSKHKIPFDKLKNKKLITLGSTHFPEEEQLLPHMTSSQADWSNRQLCIIPRDPKRASTLMKNFSRKFINKEKGELVNCAYLNSLHKKNNPEVHIYIVNTMGLSLDIYAVSDLVLIGDSFRVSQGGHNFLEPLIFGTPCIYGDNLKVFSDIAALCEEEKLTYRAVYEELPILMNKLLADSRHDEKKKKVERREKIRQIIKQNKPPKDIVLQLFQ